jgi:mono/diheme cytochrome c family protein
MLFPRRSPQISRFALRLRSTAPRSTNTSFPALITTLVLASSPCFAQVSGVVREAVTETPIEGALVTQQTTAIRTTTAVDGTFTLDGADDGIVTIVGAIKGYFNAGVMVTAPVSDIVIELAPVPQDDDDAFALTSPFECERCHPEQYVQWTDSPMAKAGVNTWVFDIYDGSGTAGGMGGFVYTRDSAFAASNPESECSSCHQPQSWIEDPFSALVPKESTDPGVVHGVSCDVCHKIADIDISKPNFPGIFPGIVTFTRPSGPGFKQVQYGVLGDTNYSRPDDMRPSYQPQLVAEVCAACHQDKNDPDEDHDFEEANGVISEPTYLEWLESPYGDEESPMYATCVDCHMPAYGGEEVCDKLFPPLLRDPDTVRSHSILGTTAEYLENAVEVTVDASIEGDKLDVDVALTNSLTGHHVPTGVTVRNMILLVEAWRESDGSPLASTGTQTIHDLGGIGNPAQGYYAGLPGKFYAKVNHDALGNGPTFFTDATGLQFDNRLPALATDNTSYSFTVPPGSDTLHVKARVIYRRAFRFLVDAKNWTVDGHGNPLEDVLAPDFGHLMASATAAVASVSCEGEPAGAPCSDGDVCNGDETCDGAGTCVAGTPLACDDAVACNGDETCDAELGCQDGTPPDCSVFDDECVEGTCEEGPMPCVALSRCGHPLSSAAGAIVASDALFALRAAVGSDICPLCVCDVNADGALAASDALRLLRAAVDSQTPVDCGGGAP